MNVAEKILTPDRDQIATFVDVLFRYASPGGFVSLRAFDEQDRSAPPFRIKTVRIGADLVPAIVAADGLAAACANAERPIVFCPPVCTFKTDKRAKEEDLAEGVALSVECDSNPEAAREKLEGLLGPATVIVSSGGQWTDPATGEVQDKLHLHWRLTEPTQTPEDHAQLKRLRRLATDLVGGDGTNVTIVHPIRWPGSWHRKAAPRMARTVALNEGAEIDLQDALERLQETAEGALPPSGGAAPAHDYNSARRIDAGFLGKTPKDYARLIAELAIDGKKHDAVVALSSSLAAQGCSRRFVEGFIRHHCPVWDKGVEDAIDSGFAKYACETVEAQVGEAEPVDLWGRFLPPPLPTGLLPKIIEDFAFARGAQMGADPAGLAVAALVTCAAAVSDRIRVKVKVHDDWVESARIWAALVADPSGKKSPILSAATGPLCRIDAEMFRDWQRRMREYEKLEKDEKKTVEPPPQRRLRIEDTTIESAQGVLADSPDRVLLLQDELSGFFGAMDKYNGGKGASADRAFWLRAFNGGPYALNRVGRGAMLIDNLSVCLLGGIQPSPIRKVAAESHDDGLLQRLFPIVLRPATVGRDEPLPPAVASYDTLVSRVRYMSGTPSCLITVTFDEEAQEIRKKLEAEHLRLQSMEVISPKLASHIGKYDGLFARLALLFHCIEAAHNGGLPQKIALPDTITADTARRAGRFLHRFLLPHAFAFYGGVLGLSDDHDRLTAVANMILAHGLTEVKRRDIQRSARSLRNLSDRETLPLLEQLEALGWVERAPGPRPTLGPVWIVNPRVHERFADRAAAEQKRRAAAHADLKRKIAQQ